MPLTTEKKYLESIEKPLKDLMTAMNQPADLGGAWDLRLYELEKHLGMILKKLKQQ